MCGRYSLTLSAADLAERFDAAAPDDWEPRYNCAPGQELPVVADDDPGSFRRMRWGYTPPWADESRDLINARAETVDEKRAFAESFESRRCLVPADGFYEWSDHGGEKRPYRVAFGDDRAFAMAGIHAMWEPPTPGRQAGLGEWGGGDDALGDDAADERIEAFAVLTTEPNDLIADLHHRMAVVLPRDREGDWLAGDLGTADLLTPYPGGDMRFYPVSTRINSPANDDPSLIEAQSTR
ncbi:SOS response-associated peptidase [Halobaculum gomorrense]|uniref:Putative SOS response-associated peptidase YedK n=1 Tax=Halobaculum gomorrense TaxID=43928 RepID=A0A1M5RIZ1_9EURY|nr:SOS response-associated peptidase [Halobaculum gomorrense]SHH26068.1 Putative SOS response-associated peptidase YedK [Halobaculum gomorrense]